MKKHNKILLILFITAISFSACKKFLDVVPDNVATINSAFSLRIEAEKFLHTCYSYLPMHGEPEYNLGFSTGDETWFPKEDRWMFDSQLWHIAKGNQRKDNPYGDYWNGSNRAEALFQAISDCNIFLENVKDLSKVRDINIGERTKWLGEVEFLKAYYHFYLLRNYGPIPIVRKNLPISASPDEVMVKRAPIDSVVAYIVELLDSAAYKLPLNVIDNQTELGRITRPVALGIKAKVLLYAASPLFNGNTEMALLKNKDGQQLFNQKYDESKWQKAAEAAKVAIESSESAGARLYKFEFVPAGYKISDTTKIQLGIRGAVSERWNPEVIWGNTNTYGNAVGRNGRSSYMQQVTMGHVYDDLPQDKSVIATSQVSATMKMAELFYTKNGVPINEDKTLDFTEPNKLRVATADEKFNIKQGYTTARLNFDRENRFYADLGFDGGTWFMASKASKTDLNPYVMEAKKGQRGNEVTYGLYSATGYFVKKIPHWESNFISGNVVKEFAWPEMRLADLYLMYAEALNEAQGPVEDVHTYLDKVRERAALPTVKESWNKFSLNPSKYTTKEGMRSIIRQERGIELAFEGNRIWDLKRWKEANRELNKPVRGWTITASDALSYYQPRVVYLQRFVAPRDYFWPLKANDVTVNTNLVQNLGW